MIHSDALGMVNDIEAAEGETLPEFLRKIERKSVARSRSPAFQVIPVFFLFLLAFALQIQ
jgi:hypothetical protein